MASIRAGPIIGSSFAVGLAPAAAGCVSRVADVPAGVPEGWAKFLPQSMAWSGSQFTDQSDFIHTLSEAEKQEANDALQAFKALELDGDCVSRDNFPLPTLGPRLDLIRRDVHQGKGFGVIRGLDTKKYSPEDLTVLYLGLQSYIANRHGRQDRKGNMLVHIVADNSSKLKAGHHRHSTSPINFHNEEAGDIVSWLTRSTAVSGGKCIIASVYTVYNVLAASRPDMIRTLSRSDWPFALPRFQCRPVLFHHEGRVMMNFGRVALTGNAVHPRPANLPAVTPRQMEALDSIENIAKATQLEISTQAGDIHFINNLTVLHRREGFVNGEGAQERRHLVRMRLRDDELGWSLPADLKEEWDAAFNKEAPKIWHIEPMPDGFFPLRSQAN
ncbi:related to TfdA family oxidoreductase [Fusarium torulosum]|uniref:Related to TfdA family oxidoreductase n=1 Tax=Fusarium torulosum TaxID=33205 RepID=A0AAE8M0Y4_9HYPO|nr:related to TfdA family oxidoreductase [Fusarium torulosum]